MFANLESFAIRFLRWSERYTKTDMVYFVKGSYWWYLNYITTNALGLGLSIAFAHLMPKQAFGSYQYILTIGSILSALTLTGMNNAVTRAVAQGREGVVTASIPIQLKYGTLCSIAAFAIALYYFLNGNFLVAAGVSSLGIFIPVVNTFNTHLALLNGRKDFRRGFYYSIIPTALYSGVMLLALNMTDNPAFLVSINFGINATATAALFFVALRSLKPTDSLDEKAISYGKHLSMANFIAAVAAQIDNVLIFHFLGAVNLAMYSFASIIPEKIGGLLKTVNFMALPKLSTRQEPDILKSIAAKSVQYALLFSCFAFIYIFLAPTIFHYLFLPYADSVTYSQGYAIALAIASLSSFPLTALTAIAAQREIYSYTILTSIISIALMTALALLYGIWGVIVARGLAGVIHYVVIMTIIKQRKGRVS